MINFIILAVFFQPSMATLTRFCAQYGKTVFFSYMFPNIFTNSSCQPLKRPNQFVQLKTTFFHTLRSNVLACVGGANFGCAFRFSIWSLSISSLKMFSPFDHFYGFIIVTFKWFNLSTFCVYGLNRWFLCNHRVKLKHKNPFTSKMSTKCILILVLFSNKKYQYDLKTLNECVTYVFKTYGFATKISKNDSRDRMKSKHFFLLTSFTVSFTVVCNDISSCACVVGSFPKGK